MNRSSQEEEILSFVSKKLATAHLSRRRSHTSTTHGLYAMPRPSRIEKPSSRHGSPKILEKRSINNAPRFYPTTDNALVAPPSRMVPQPRPSLAYSSRPERPYSWHPSSHNASDISQLPYPGQPTTGIAGYPNDWQLSSYEWPGESAYINQQLSYGLQQPAQSAQQATQFGITKPFPSASESTFGPCPAWHPQPQQSTIPVYASESFVNNQRQVQSFAMYPAARNHVLGQPRSQDHFTLESSQVPQHVELPLVQREVNLSGHHPLNPLEEELVGLGLYDKEEDTPPLQLCAGLSASVPNHFVGGIAGKGLKLEETWQPPPEWQQSESTEGSEASASPFEETQHYAPADQSHITFTQMPQQYALDFEADNFLFDGADEWFTGSVKATPTSDVGYAGYDWFGNGTGNVSY